MAGSSELRKRCRPTKRKRITIFFDRLEDEKGPSSVRPAVELFQRQHWRNVWKFLDFNVLSTAQGHLRNLWGRG